MAGEKAFPENNHNHACTEHNSLFEKLD